MSRSCLLFVLLCCVALVALAADEPTDGSLPLSVTEGVANPTIPDPVTTIYDWVRQSEPHSILFRLIDSNEQTRRFLNDKGGRFTLFAPVDNAFIRLANSLSPGVTIDAQTDIDDVIAAIVSAIENIRQVKGFANANDIVLYHVVEQAYPIETLIELRSSRTVLGRPANLTFFEGNVVVDADDSRNNATANPTNIFALNGWIHQIYGVLLPFRFDEAVSLITSQPTPVVTPVVTPQPTPVPEDDATEEEPTEEGTDEDSTDEDATDEDSTDEDGDGDSTVTEGADSTSEDDDDDDDVCFPASATVTTVDGSTLRMADLQAGQHIHHDEHGASSPVFLFTHRTLNHEQLFYRISTASGHAVSMTANHYLYVDGRLRAAHAVQIGNVVRTKSGPSAVVKVERVRDVGLYAPHSLHGDVLVDGIVCSSYSRAVAPRLAHALLLPLRWFVRASGAREVLPGVFYDGGRGLERFVPKGLAAY